MLVSTTCYLLHLWHTRLHSSTTGRGSEPKRLLFAPPAVSFFSSSLGVKVHTQESRTEKSHLEPTTPKKSAFEAAAFEFAIRSSKYAFAALVAMRLHASYMQVVCVDGKAFSPDK